MTAHPAGSRPAASGLLRRAAALAAAFALAALWALALAPPAAAQTGGIDAFVGTYVGVAEVYGAGGELEEERHMDVTIQRTERDGFRIVWTNVTLVDGRRDVPGVQRRVEEVVFVPDRQGAIYVEDTRGSMFQTRAPIDAMAGDPIRWARIDGNRLGVFSMVVMPDGRYELQAYERLLTDVGLDIDFRRILDGQVVRLIEGRTVRVN